MADTPSRSTLTELDTKRLYLGLALLFVADTAGLFAASIPTAIFAALFLIVVGIDAYA